MATRETGIAVAVVGALGVIAAACISSGVYKSVCPESLCGSGQVEIAPPDNPPPDGCKQGFVWREAVKDDHVCVTPETRSQAAKDNQQAAARRNPNGGPYGPDTCIQGYVWRGAVDSDHVCVTPQTRDQTARDNSLAASRRAGG
ncbi:MAG TPA: hypothetical protein VFC19_32210 [Candidatus Limnocylindrales bacterium]|nr:hypothetical protein [Candidatus Limnocylindrales bacterium]